MCYAFAGSAIVAIPELRTTEAVPSALTPIRRACQQESMPVCQRPARRIAPVAAGHQLELAEVGRDRHESERRVDGCLVAGEVCAQLGRSGQRLWRWSGGTTVQANGNCGVVGRLAEHSVIGLAFAPTRHPTASPPAPPRPPTPNVRIADSHRFFRMVAVWRCKLELNHSRGHRV